MSNHDYLSQLLEDLNYSNTEETLPQDVMPLIGFLISKAAQSIVSQVDKSLAPFGIGSRHYGIMLVLSRQDGLPQAAIGDKLQIDRTTIVKLVDELEGIELVERHRDPKDRRAYALSLSEKGRQTLPDITSAALDVEQLSLSSLTAEEMRTLFHLLTKFQTTD